MLYQGVRWIIGTAIFVASYVILTFLVVPWFTQRGAPTPLDETTMARFPVAVAIRDASAGTTPKFAVAQIRHLQDLTAKATSYSFLLPAGSHEITDQDGDPASYIADNISPGRQRVRLKAMVGDYKHEVEYEAEEKKVVPLRDGSTGPQFGLYTIPISALLAWLGLWLFRRSGWARRLAREPQG
jgi:hypothetical protein